MKSSKGGKTGTLKTVKKIAANGPRGHKPKGGKGY